MYKQIDEFDDIEELEHHGIMGMRWGVRRYQNLDGTLTELGKKRFQKVSDSKFNSWRDTRRAKKILKNEKSQYKALGEEALTKSVEAERLMKKGGKTLITRKYKNLDAADNYRKYKDLAQEYLEKSDIAAQKLKDIKNGNLKAGRDFIIQRDFNFLTDDEKRRIIEKA